MKRDPVCHISPTKPAVLPSLKNLPQIPPATDLKSALAAIGAMTMIIRILTGDNGINGQNGQNGGGGGDSKSDGDWREQNRVTEKKRIYNPKDKSQYIDVERINSLTMSNEKTKSRWKWDRQR